MEQQTGSKLEKKYIKAVYCHPVSDGKESACKAEDPSLILGLGRSSGEGNSITLQYSCLENSVDRGAWWITVHGDTKNQIKWRD